MPSSRELPEELEPLRRRNAIELSHTRFNTDADRLAEAIDRALKQAKAQREPAQQTRKASASMERGETEQTPAENAEAEQMVSRKVEAKQPSGKKGESSPEEQRRILLRSIFIAACLVIIFISAIVFYSAHPRGAQVKPTPSPTLKRQREIHSESKFELNLFSPGESTALTPSIVHSSHDFETRIGLLEALSHPDRQSITPGSAHRLLRVRSQCGVRLSRHNREDY